MTLQDLPISLGWRYLTEYEKVALIKEYGLKVKLYWDNLPSDDRMDFLYLALEANPDIYHNG